MPHCEHTHVRWPVQCTKYNVHSMYLRMDMRMREYAVHADYAHIRKYLDADLIHIILI